MILQQCLVRMKLVDQQPSVASQPLCLYSLIRKHDYEVEESGPSALSLCADSEGDGLLQQAW